MKMQIDRYPYQEPDRPCSRPFQVMLDRDRTNARRRLGADCGCSSYRTASMTLEAGDGQLPSDSEVAHRQESTAVAWQLSDGESRLPLCRASFVAVVQTTDLRNGHDATVGGPSDRS